MIYFSREVLYGMFYQAKPYRKDSAREEFLCATILSEFKFKYNCFDHVILPGYIRWLFFPGGVVKFLRTTGFKKLSNGVIPY